MKKVALLFTILCTNALNGMETKRGVWDYLPQEIQSIVVKKALESSNNPDEAIIVLKNLSTLHGAQFDKLFSKLEDFTTLVHILSDKFNTPTMFIADRFNTPAAKTYLNLANDLMKACENNDIDKVKKLFEQGADANLGYYLAYLPLDWAVRNGNAELVRLLLDNGAKPIEELYHYYNDWLIFKPQKEKIKQMLEDAVQKQKDRKS